MAPTTFGQLHLTVKDAASGEIVPARIGLYDATGRMPLPSDEALMLQRFADDVRLLPNGSVHVWFERGAECSLPVDGVHAGIMDLSAVQLPQDAVYYLCGPLPFMQAVRSDLIAHAVPAKDIQYEVFGPDLWLADFE